MGGYELSTIVTTHTEKLSHAQTILDQDKRFLMSLIEYFRNHIGISTPVKTKIINAKHNFDKKENHISFEIFMEVLYDGKQKTYKLPFSANYEDINEYTININGNHYKFFLIKNDHLEKNQKAMQAIQNVFEDEFTIKGEHDIDCDF